MAQKLANYVRTYRKKAGLSQRDVGLILGYPNEGQVSRYERFHSRPPLAVALQYEALFHVPVSTLFGGAYESAAASVNERLTAFEASLKLPAPHRKRERGQQRKLEWLLSRDERAASTHVNERAAPKAPHGMRSSVPKTSVCSL